jgi:hypothetical protein
MAGGATYKVLKWGPITGQGGKRLGMGILYAAKSTELAVLKSAAADLFAYVVPETEREHDDAVAVMAQSGWNENGKSITFGIIYKLESHGWHVVPPDVSKPTLQVVRPIDAQAAVDLDAEAKAKATVDAWLPFVDADDVERSWASAAEMMKRSMPKTAWSGALRTIRSRTGKLMSRSLFSMTATAALPNAPQGKYVMVQFRSRFPNADRAVEEVIAALCDDGKWRVAGYEVFYGASLAATVVNDAHPTR